MVTRIKLIRGTEKNGVKGMKEARTKVLEQETEPRLVRLKGRDMWRKRQNLEMSSVNCAEGLTCYKTRFCR